MESEGRSDRRAASGAAVWQQGPDGMLVVLEGRIVDCNRRFLGWTEHSRDSVEEKSPREFLAALDGAGDMSLDDALAGRRKAPLDVRCRQGSRAPAILQMTVSPLDGGESLVILRDVFEQRVAMNESQQKRTALEDSLNGYDIVDTTGKFIYANRAYLQMWGYDSLNDLVGMTTADHCADPQTAKKIIAELERNGRTTIEFTAKRKDGSTFDAVMAAHVSRDENGNKVYVGTSLDISDQKRFRDELSHFRKMEAVGGLAASVAHDFSNMLSPILGFTELMQRDPTLSAEQREQLDHIHSAAERSRMLTSRLFAFSRQQVLEPRPTDLREAVTELEPLVRQTLREDIKLVVHLCEQPCRVMLDQAQLHQLLLSLVSNAQDAMGEGGQLTIEVGHRRLDEDYCAEHRDVSPGDFGELAVSDNGKGISDEARAKLFEPFFTTKGEFGTGLGLASVHGIAKQHGGNVLVYSEPDRGTTFKVYLPLTDKAAAPAELSAGAEEVAAGGKVLLLEDDELVRQVAERVLEQGGFQVVTACSIEQAREILFDLQVRPDVLLTDVILPDGNGRQFADLAREVHPDLRVLFMSGYTDNVIVHHGVLESDENFIQKPFSVSDLQNRVRGLIARSP